MTEEAKPKKPGKKPGAAKTGGRQKGTRNRNSLNVLTALDKANYPIIELLVAQIGMLEPAQQVEKYFQLLGYCYPKLKEIEFTPPTSPAGTQATPEQPKPRTPQDRLSNIRNGHFAHKSAASGK